MSKFMEEVEACELILEGKHRDENKRYWSYIRKFSPDELPEARIALAERREYSAEKWSGTRIFRLVKVTVKTVTEVLDAEGVTVNG